MQADGAGERSQQAGKPDERRVARDDGDRRDDLAITLREGRPRRRQGQHDKHPGQVLHRFGEMQARGISGVVRGSSKTIVL
jgi:hypothetical protein